ncbi:MAG: alcohol acetyltransferase [Oscillospiraceae bacterium]
MANKPGAWMKLDNAAKIYPSTMRRNWMSMFRMSAVLTEPVDGELLTQALRQTLPRFPGTSVHLRRGMFWFYYEHADGIPPVGPDVTNPCVRINLHENGRFMFRVRFHDCRIAVETFHGLTDGHGGLCFIKTLVAEYLTLRYAAVIPRDAAILDCSEPPKPSELEDAFLRYATPHAAARDEKDAYYIRGEKEPPDVVHITTGMIPVAEVLERAKAKGVTLTQYLTAVLLLAVDTVQRRNVKQERRLRLVRVSVPVNLRSFFPSETLRNFSLFVNVGIDPRLGTYSFDEMLNAVHSTMRHDATEKNLRARFSANVRSEKNIFLRVMPLFLKNLVLRVAVSRIGDRKASTTLTNLGRVTLPPEMSRYVTRLDVMLGPLSRSRVMCAALSYNGTLYFTFTRTITDSSVEREFFRRLVRLGIHVKLESNNQW